MSDTTDLKLSFDSPDAIRRDILETFPYKGHLQEIRYETREFSAVCPFSGLPDIATVIVEYIPNEVCIELKSLKLYFVSYRNIGIYQEHATDRIFSDLWELLRPRWLKITTEYAVRGGISAKCTIEKGHRESSG